MAVHIVVERSAALAFAVLLAVVVVGKQGTAAERAHEIGAALEDAPGEPGVECLEFLGSRGGRVPFAAGLQPGLVNVWVGGLAGGIPAHSEDPLVDERDERKARFVLVGAARVGVHMLQKLARPAAPVGEGPVMDAHIGLVEILVECVVAVDADVAPWRFPRHIEVCRHIDAALKALGKEIVEAVDVVVGNGRGLCPRSPDAAFGAGGERLGPCAIMVVDAKCVVAKTHETIDEAVGKVVVGVVGREAEVDAIEALLDPRQPLELEVAAYGFEPAVLAGGSVLQPQCRKVERGAGHDVLLVVKAHPVVAFGNFNRLGEGEREAAWSGQRHVPFHLLPRRVGAWSNGGCAESDGPAPAFRAQVLRMVGDGIGEREAGDAAIGKRQFKVRCGAIPIADWRIIWQVDHYG